MPIKVAVILSGCGVYDGSEIHESVLTLLALSRKGYLVDCLAPDINQAHVIDHREGKQTEGPVRNVMVEAARISRGKIRDLALAECHDYDALIFPGGFGAAKNLSDYAFKGAAMTVQEDVARLIRDFHEARKPMVFFCIAPILAARVLGRGVELTIGCDPGTSAHINGWGAIAIDKPVTEHHLDRINKIISAPAYMYDATIAEVEQGIAAGINELAGLLDG